MIKMLRLLLLPFSILYGLIILIRNVLYDFKILPSEKFELPVISVGNLVIGGTGKTPMTEYLIRLLKKDYKIATLSRGYGRKTKGFVVASPNSKSTLIGDEPKQYKQKYPEIIVSVCEKRRLGIANLRKNYHPDIILLDDAYQHRSVVPGLSILVMECKSIYAKDFMLPTGNLREFKFGKSRANIIIVSKCPSNLSLEDREEICSYLNPNADQKVYFSYIEYGHLKPYSSNELGVQTLPNDMKEYSIIALSGIANPKPFFYYLQQQSKEVHAVAFSDHHDFTEEDIKKVVERYRSIANKQKLIVTTEKDLMRLAALKPEILSLITPIFYLPISAKFFKEDEMDFNENILKYVRTSKANS